MSIKIKNSKMACKVESKNIRRSVTESLIAQLGNSATSINSGRAVSVDSTNTLNQSVDGVYVPGSELGEEGFKNLHEVVFNNLDEGNTTDLLIALSPYMAEGSIQRQVVEALSVIPFSYKLIDTFGEGEENTYASITSNTRVIKFSKERIEGNSLEVFMEAALHEVVHAYTLTEYRDNETFRNDIDALYKKSVNSKLGADDYGYTTPLEFITEIFVNPKFANDVRRKDRSIINSLINYILKRLGIKNVKLRSQGTTYKEAYNLIENVIVKENNKYLETFTSALTSYDGVNTDLEKLGYYDRVIRTVDNTNKLYQSTKYGDVVSLEGKTTINIHPTQELVDAVNEQNKRDEEKQNKTIQAEKDNIRYQKGETSETVILDQEVIDKLEESGLANNIYQLSPTELEAKLKEIGVTEEVRKQMLAWHGSPHIVDKFSTDKIGTGEGKQAFGWGLYFTDLENIARNYADSLTKTKGFSLLGSQYTSKWDGIIRSKGESRSYLKDGKKISKIEYNIAKKIANTKANLYKVSLHKGKDVSDYTWLEWSKELTENQITQLLDNDIEASITEALWHHYSKDSDISTTKDLIETMKADDITGSRLYKILQENIDEDPSPRRASLALLNLGIDGIKYPAESRSRGATSDTARGFNYVVFDENAITIEEHIQFQKQLSKEGITLTTNGFVYKGDVYLNKETATNDTAIHEYSHLFSSWLQKNKPETYQKGLDLISEELKKDNSEIQSIIDYVEQTQPSLKSEAKKEEILSQLIGERGAELIENSKTKGGIIDWLKDVWKQIGQLLGITKMTPQQISSLTLQEYTDAVVADLMSGDKFKEVKKENPNAYSQAKTNLPEQAWYITQTPSFKKWFGKSVILDENGDPLVQWHWSPVTNIDAFNLSGIGTHIGTVEQAEQIQENHEKDGQYYPVFIKMENPLKINDIGGHLLNMYLPTIEEGFRDAGITLTEEDLAVFNNSMLNIHGQHTPLIKDLLNKYGFDGFEYENGIEDVGATSYIIVDKQQVKQLSESIFTEENSDSTVEEVTMDDINECL